ncbi:MAG: 50S ribosomal protein L18 [Candidatus Dojkabacteria bacterium]|nr:50S ribosomal protein L18 [Candidatus Dojkabacteria bacterium]MDQ7021374.1 50S ribosomal protein L18 [Candidatus Dojkabacteria bacterium]
MSKIIDKQKKYSRRKRGVRKNIEGSSLIPRVTVKRSNKHIQAQAIDDGGRITLAASSDFKTKTGTKAESAKAVGLQLGKDMVAKKIDKIVFDRNGYKYHGRVSALADGLREAGIKF